MPSVRYSVSAALSTAENGNTATESIVVADPRDQRYAPVTAAAATTAAMIARPLRVRYHADTG